MASKFFRSRSSDTPTGEHTGILWPKRIAVPARGAPVDKDALKAACRLARPAKAEILVITVLEVARHLPLSASLGDELGHSEEMLAEMEAVAAELGARIQTTILQAREAGPAIVDETLRWEADLLVVGLGIKPRFGEFTLGETGAHLLSHAHCRLILLRQAMTAEQAEAS